MNEHLIEALRRLRKSSSDTNVDRRLVTNVFLSFLSTPRADPKRFEMLGLIGTILGWGEAERERAGLIKGLGAATGGGTSGSASSSSGGGLFWGRGNGAASPGKSKNVELEKTDETEVCLIYNLYIRLTILLRSSFLVSPRDIHDLTITSIVILAALGRVPSHRSQPGRVSVPPSAPFIDTIEPPITCLATQQPRTFTKPCRPRINIERARGLANRTQRNEALRLVDSCR